jgi:hypothetical protein
LQKARDELRLPFGQDDLTAAGDLDDINFDRAKVFLCSAEGYALAAGQDSNWGRDIRAEVHALLGRILMFEDNGDKPNLRFALARDEFNQAAGLIDCQDQDKADRYRGFANVADARHLATVLNDGGGSPSQPGT